MNWEIPIAILWVIVLVCVIGAFALSLYAGRWTAELMIWIWGKIKCN